MSPQRRHLESIRLIIPLLGSLAMVSSAAMGQSAESESAPPLDVDALSVLNERPVLDVTLGIWFPRLEGTIDIGPNGTKLDAGNDLSLDDSQAIFNGEARVQAGRWEFLLGGYVVNATGNAALTGPARIGGLFAPAGTTVDSSVDVWSITGEVAYSIFTPFHDRRFAWSDPVDRSKGNRTSDGRRILDFRFEILFGTRFINIEQQYDLAGIGTVGANNTWVSPYLGVGIEVDWDTRATFGFLDRIGFDVTAGWGPAFGGGNSSLTIRVDGAFYVTRDLALTLGYRLNDFNLVRDEAAFDGGLQGLFAGVRYTW
jgi:hypothetical protein